MDMLTGIHRYFPNTMIVGLIVLGIALARVSWVLVGIGGIVVALIVFFFQIIFGLVPGAHTEQTPGLLEACSVLPLPGAKYEKLPSYWLSATTFFLTYILSNAISIAQTNPTKQPNTAIAVQQRKGLGVISIVAVVVIGLIMLGVRMMGQCESWWGLLASLIIGGGGGYGWWYMLNAQQNDIFQDIHGVMIGLQPGDLRTGPVACVPSSA
jgi:hypothetical protein